MILPGVAAAPKRVGPPSRKGVRPVAAAFLGPAIALSAALFSYPAVASLIDSFSRTDATGDVRFVGMANYVRLFSDRVFWTSLTNTLVFAVIFVAGTVGIGLVLALALYERIPGHRLWRFVILAPSFLPLAFIAVVWAIGLDPSIGWVTNIVRVVDPSFSQTLLSDPRLVMPTIAVVSIIQGVGWPMAIMWTSLQDVSPEMVEASTVDGAGYLQRARFILVPSVRATIGTVTLLQVIFSLKVFDMVYVMTAGGPDHASESLTVFVYNQAFENADFGYGCAGAVVSCLLIVGITVAGVRLGRIRGFRT